MTEDERVGLAWDYKADEILRCGKPVPSNEPVPNPDELFKWLEKRKQEWRRENS